MRNYDSASRCARTEFGELLPRAIIEKRRIFRIYDGSRHARAQPEPLPSPTPAAILCTWCRAPQGELICVWAHGTPPALDADLGERATAPSEPVRATASAATFHCLSSPAWINLTLQLTKVVLAAAALGLAASHQAHAAMLAYGALSWS